MKNFNKKQQAFLIFIGLVFLTGFYFSLSLIFKTELINLGFQNYYLLVFIALSVFFISRKEESLNFSKLLLSLFQGTLLTCLILVFRFSMFYFINSSEIYSFNALDIMSIILTGSIIFYNKDNDYSYPP